MPRKLTETVLVLSLTAALAGCGSTPTTKTEPPSPGPELQDHSGGMVVLAIPAAGSGSEAGTSADDDTYSLQVPVGAQVEVTLPFQAGTGYSWALASHSDGLSLVNTSTRSMSKDGRTGGPMQATYILRLNPGDGSDNAIFKLARPWETEEEPARTVKVDFSRKTRQG